MNFHLVAPQTEVVVTSYVQKNKIIGFIRAPNRSLIINGVYPYAISRKILGNYPEFSRNVLGIILVISWKIPGNVLEISRKFPEISWIIPGNFPRPKRKENLGKPRKNQEKLRKPRERLHPTR